MPVQEDDLCHVFFGMVGIILRLVKVDVILLFCERPALT